MTGLRNSAATSRRMKIASSSRRCRCGERGRRASGSSNERRRSARAETEVTRQVFRARQQKGQGAIRRGPDRALEGGGAAKPGARACARLRGLGGGRLV